MVPIGPTRVYSPNGISIGSVVFAGLTIVTDAHTNAHTHAQAHTFGQNVTQESDTFLPRDSTHASTVYTVFQKKWTTKLMVVTLSNLNQPIFKILSLLDSVINLQQSHS